MTLMTHTTGRTLAPARTRGVVATVLSWLHLSNSRIDLTGLDSQMLHDIGVSEKEADREAKRPFWDVPSNWRL